MADVGLIHDGGQVALNLTQLATLAVSGLVALLVNNMRKDIKAAHDAALKAQKESQEGNEKLAARMDAICARVDDKRTVCQAENDVRFARKEDVHQLRKDVGEVFGRVRTAEMTATEARAYASGVEKTVAALCGDK